jgi:raffinose/stachyose/melibiose transport system permease protein
MVSTLAARPTRPSRRSDGMSAISGTRSRGFWFFLIPGLLLFTFIILIPLVWNVFLSFTEYRGIRPPEFIGLENWIELVGDAKFWASFRNSLAMIVAMVIIPTLLGLVLAALLFDVIGRKFGGRVASFLRATYYLPQILPVAIAAIVIGWILRPENGALNTVLENIGLGELAHNWLGSPDTALASIMVVMVWVQIGYPVVIFMAALQRVDPELYEAAELDGAGPLRRFWHVTLPLLSPVIFFNLVMGLIHAVQAFTQVYIVSEGQGAPAGSTLMLSLYVFLAAFKYLQMGYASAIAWSMFVLIVLVTWALFRSSRYWVFHQSAGRL